MASEQEDVKQSCETVPAVKVILTRRQQGVEVQVESNDALAAYNTMVTLVEALDVADLRGYQDGTKNKKRASLTEEGLQQEVEKRTRAKFHAMRRQRMNNGENV